MTIKIKVWTYLPNQKSLREVSQKALSHNHQYWSRGTHYLEVQVAPKKVATFLEHDGDIYVRPKLHVHPSSGSGPNYICQACGCQIFSNTVIVVKAGEDQWHAITYTICSGCIKSGALEALRRDHPTWYIRLQS